jgi:hypothetical protein
MKAGQAGRDLNLYLSHKPGRVKNGKCINRGLSQGGILGECAPLVLHLIQTDKAQSETGYSLSPERDAGKHNVLCFQSISRLAVKTPLTTDQANDPGWR